MAEAHIHGQQNGQPAVPPWMKSTGCVLLFAVASACFFRGAWNPTNTLEGTDASLWLPMFLQHWTAGLFIPRWFPHFLAGLGQQFHFLSHGLPLILTLPPHRFYAFQFMLDTFLCGAFMFAFLRSRGIGLFGALVGGLAYQLGNNILTNAAQGGLWKFETICWVPLFLLFFCRVIEGAPGRLKNAVFAGAALGLQFLGGEVQLTYYVCLLALAYFIFDSLSRLWSRRKTVPPAESLRSECKSALWAALCAALGIAFAAEVFCSYAVFAGSKENVGVSSEKDNWRFVTEWSFPPEETLSLALSGGVFASDTYSRGYMGQPIERISDDYVGIVVLLFAFLAFFSGTRRPYFWGCAAVAALLLSYGRYFPLFFRLVYELPAMKGLRTPHKWLFLTALCVPVLAGIGADFWKTAPPSKDRKIIVAILLFVLAIAAVVIIAPSITGISPRLTFKGVWAPLAVLALAFLACVFGRTGRARTSRRLQLIVPVIVVALLAVDPLINASKYMSYYDYRDRYIEDELVNWLRSKPKPFRVKLWSENPYLRYLTTEVLPYHGIDTADAILSRRPRRYSEFFRAVREGTIPFERYLQMFNAKYVLSPLSLAGVDIPFKLSASFRTPSDAGPPGECHVYEFADYLPRAYIVGKFEVTETENVLNSLGKQGLDLSRVVILEKRPLSAPGVQDVPPEWNIKSLSNSPHRVVVNITVDRPAILVVQDFTDAYWHVYVDTEKAELMRANYLMRAVSVPEGSHTVTFTYDPPLWGYAVTLLGWIVIVSLIVCNVVRYVMTWWKANITTV